MSFEKTSFYSRIRLQRELSEKTDRRAGWKKSITFPMLLLKIDLKSKLQTSKVIVRILVVFRVLLSPLQSLQRLVLTLVRIWFVSRDSGWKNKMIYDSKLSTKTFKSTKHESFEPGTDFRLSSHRILLQNFASFKLQLLLFSCPLINKIYPSWSILLNSPEIRLSESPICS